MRRGLFRTSAVTAVLAVLAGLTVGPALNPDREALSLGRRPSTPGEGGGAMGGRGDDRPVVVFVGDDSASMRDAVVRWADVPTFRPLRQARTADPDGFTADLLFVHTASPDLLGPDERTALATTGRYVRPGTGDDSWRPDAAAGACADAASGLDGVACGPHALGLTGDDLLRSAAAALRTATRGSGWLGADLAVGVVGGDGEFRMVTHSLCDVRNDAFAPCTLPADGAVEGTFAALAVRPAGAGRLSSAAEALRRAREEYLTWGNVIPDRAASTCAPVRVVLVGDLDLTPEEATALRAEADALRQAVVTVGFTAVPLKPLTDEARTRLLEALGPGTVVLPPADLLRDPLAVVPPTTVGGVTCLARAWTVRSSDAYGPVRSDFVVQTAGTAARVGLKPWTIWPDATDLAAEAAWAAAPADWHARATWLSYVKGGRLETVRVDDGSEEAVAVDVAAWLGLSPDTARRLLRFHRGDPAQEVDVGGAWRDRCAPWTGDCRTATEVLGPVLWDVQVVRAWRPTSALSDFFLWTAPSWDERAAWGPDEDGTLFVGTSQGLTAYRVRTRPPAGRPAAEELWHHVPAGLLQNIAASAVPTRRPTMAPVLRGLQMGDRRLLVFFRGGGGLTVYDATGRPGPDRPVVLYDSVLSGSATATGAVPLFAVLADGASLRPAAALGIVGPPGRVCVRRLFIDGGPEGAVDACVDVGTTAVYGAYSSGHRGYDAWFVFAPWPYPAGDDVDTVLVRYRIDAGAVTAWWRLRVREVRDDGSEVLGPVAPARIAVTEDTVALLGLLGYRRHLPHTGVVALWLPVLEARRQAGSRIVVGGDDDTYVAEAEAGTPTPEGYAWRFVRTSRPWQSFCVWQGRVDMCTAWGLIFRNARTFRVFRAVGPPTWPLFGTVVGSWCPDETFYFLPLPWVWIQSPRPLPQDDPGDPTNLAMRLFYPPAPAGYAGVRLGPVRPGHLAASPWRPYVPGVGPYPEWVLTVGTAPRWANVLWLHARLQPPRRWGPAGGR